MKILRRRFECIANALYGNLVEEGSMADDTTICENCEKPIKGPTVYTDDDYPLCADCARNLR